MSNQTQEPIDPPKKVNVPQMPKWWRVLYYIFSTILLLMGAAGVYISLTN